MYRVALDKDKSYTVQKKVLGIWWKLKDAATNKPYAFETQEQAAACLFSYLESHAK